MLIGVQHARRTTVRIESRLTPRLRREALSSRPVLGIALQELPHSHPASRRHAALIVPVERRRLPSGRQPGPDAMLGRIVGRALAPRRLEPDINGDVRLAPRRRAQPAFRVLQRALPSGLHFRCMGRSGRQEICSTRPRTAIQGQSAARQGPPRRRAQASSASGRPPRPAPDRPPCARSARSTPSASCRC